MLAEMLHLARGAAQHRHFEAGVLIEMDVERGERELMVCVIGVGQPLGELPRRMVVDIDQRRDARVLLLGALGGVANAGAGEVADRLGPVLVAARGNDGVELGHERVVEGDGHSVHGGGFPVGRMGAASRALLDRRGSKSNQPWRLPQTGQVTSSR